MNRRRAYRISRLPELQRCIHAVRLGLVDTHTRRARISDAAKAGHAPDVCGRPACWMVDGEPRCLAHAGQDALAIVEQLVRADG